MYSASFHYVYTEAVTGNQRESNTLNTPLLPYSTEERRREGGREAERDKGKEEGEREAESIRC